MGFIADFLHQKTPSSKKAMPGYYRRALLVCESLLAAYYLLIFFLFPLMHTGWQWVPAVLAAIFVLLLTQTRKINPMISFLAVAALVLGWCAWGIHTVGWSYGVQHFLVILFLLLFFNIYIPPLVKLISCVLILGYRMALFAYASSNTPVIGLGHSSGIVFQTINSAWFFLMLALVCILFSSSIQNTERQLRLDNETLNKEAATDPLTGLPNRRKMINFIEDYLKKNPETAFSVAIADIDFFKKVNDTYGHACGDETLVALTNLFKTESNGRYMACRWGGEEFCFFLPEKNLDEAGMIMNDLLFAVQKMPLEFEGTSFHITITIGVEETDYHSSLEELLKSADEKLYMGKNAGRNRVVV